MRKLTEKDVTFTISCEEEYVPVKGNAIASGDSEEDARVEKSIINDFNNGNPWAWCTVKVTAKWNGFEAYEYLGCCSYQDEDDFKRPGGYYDDMRREALANLNSELEAISEKLALLRD